MANTRKRWGEMREAVMRLHREHPDWTPGQIADRLGCMREYVRKTFYRQGWTWAHDRSGRKPLQRAA